MPHFMFQAAYSQEALASLTKNPQNRADTVRRSIESLGGRVESVYFSFGEYDTVVIFEAPDNSTAAALALGVGGTGVLKAGKTTPLLSPEEAVEAMRKSGSLDYQPPG